MTRRPKLEEQMTVNVKTTTALIAAGAMATALTLISIPSASAQDEAMENCYGVALAGKNDCAAGPGTSRGVGY